MATKVMANCGPDVTYTAEELGAALRTFAANTDYIIKGIGNQMSITHSTSSLQVTVKTGEAMICGRFSMITKNETVTLPANSSVKLVFRIDLTQPVTKEGLVTYTTRDLKTDNLNNVAGQYDMLLANITTSSSGVSGFSDQRVIKDAAGSSGQEITEGWNLDLLWTNATPTSAFGDITQVTTSNAGTVSLPGIHTNYIGIVVIGIDSTYAAAKVDTSDAYYYSTVDYAIWTGTRKHSAGKITTAVEYNDLNTTGYVSSRRFQIRPNQVVFWHATLTRTIASTDPVGWDDHWSIPYKIYGIKGVTNNG